MEGLDDAPDTTKLMFLLEILDNRDKTRAKNNNGLYNIINKTKDNVKFNYINFYEYSQDGKKYNSLLNRDLDTLERESIIQYDSKNTIRLKESARRLVKTLKALYDKRYKRLESTI